MEDLIRRTLGFIMLDWPVLVAAGTWSEQVSRSSPFTRVAPRPDPHG